MPSLARLSRRKALGALLGASAMPLFSGCSELVRQLPAATPKLVEVPPCGIPRSLRGWNWGGGSCVFASWRHTEAALSFHDLAAYIRKTYSGGESYNGLTSKMRKLGVPFYSCIDGRSDSDMAAHVFKSIFLADWLDANGVKWYGTFNGDADVLERCTAERRMAVIFFKPSHSINFNGFVAQAAAGLWGYANHVAVADKAYLLDNNAIEQYEIWDKDKFLTTWRNRYGGVAVVPSHGEPPPPLPYLG